MVHHCLQCTAPCYNTTFTKACQYRGLLKSPPGSPPRHVPGPCPPQPGIPAAIYLCQHSLPANQQQACEHAAQSADMHAERSGRAPGMGMRIPPIPGIIMPGIARPGMPMPGIMGIMPGGIGIPPGMPGSMPGGMPRLPRMSPAAA